VAQTSTDFLTDGTVVDEVLDDAEGDAMSRKRVFSARQVTAGPR
jgi:hypothetical protein